MDYLNTLLQKWMPSQQRVAVDSKPTLHGIWDTINATLATTGPPTRLPPEFYDSKAYSILDRLVTEEEYSGYKESVEYRTLGIGAMLGESVQRMVHSSCDDQESRTSSAGENFVNEGDDLGSVGRDLKIALFGCHDSTIAGVLASLGAMEGENNKWPSYTSSLAIELFQTIESAPDQQQQQNLKVIIPPTEQVRGPDSEKYVRIRYNDRPITIPGCRLQGHHFEDDESICTFVKPFDFFIFILSPFFSVSLSPSICTYATPPKSPSNKKTTPLLPPTLPCKKKKKGPISFQPLFSFPLSLFLPKNNSTENPHRKPSNKSSTNSPLETGNQPAFRICTSQLFPRGASRRGIN